MTRADFPFRLYLVVSEAACRGKDPVAVTEAAIRGGVDIVQLREKHSSTPAFLEKALRLQEMLARHTIPLIINDDIEVAQRSGAYGIHVGNNDLPPAQIRNIWTGCNLLGYSIEYKEQLFNEHTPLSDCLGISPVFSTPTKTDTVTEWGIDGIREIRHITEKPLIAIGNMHAGNAQEIIRAGADCIAVVSAICQAADPERAAATIRNQIEQA
jgi:thiamine-phosphate pyrophosphorylase